MAAVGDPASRRAGRRALRPASEAGAGRRAATIGARHDGAGPTSLMPAVRALLTRRADSEGVSRRVRRILGGTRRAAPR